MTLMNLQNLPDTWGLNCPAQSGAVPSKSHRSIRGGVYVDSDLLIVARITNSPVVPGAKPLFTQSRPRPTVFDKLRLYAGDTGYRHWLAIDSHYHASLWLDRWIATGNAKINQTLIYRKCKKRFYCTKTLLKLWIMSTLHNKYSTLSVCAPSYQVI